MNENGLIYLLGGFTTISNDNENNTNISNNLQFTKFFDDKMHQFNIAKIDEENPKDMIFNKESKIIPKVILTKEIKEHDCKYTYKKSQKLFEICAFYHKSRLTFVIFAVIIYLNYILL